MFDQSEHQYLTTGAAAKHIGVSRHTILRAVRRGAITPAFRTPGGRLRFSRAEIEALAASLAPVPTAAKGVAVGRPAQSIYDAYVEAFFQVPAPIALLAQDGRWLLVNPAFCNLLGYSQEELLSLGSPALIHPDDRENAAEAQHALLTGKRLTAHFQRRYRRSNSEYLWVDVTASLVFDDEGRPLYFVNQMQDITEQKLGEEARRASEDLLRSVVTTAPLALLAVDQLGTITLIEGSACSTLGLDPTDMVGRPIGDIFPARSSFLAMARRALTGESSRAVVSIGDAVLDTRWTPLRDTNNNIVGAISISTDITTQKLAESVLIEREARFWALTEDAYDLICILDATGRVQYESPSYARLLGHPLAESQDEDLFAAFHPDDRERVAAALQQLATEHSRQIRLEFRHLGTDGTWHTLDAVIVNRLEDPAVQGIVATSRDISEHKAIMAALAASENRARILVENSPIGACIVDAAGKFEIVNAAYADIYGFEPEQLLGRPSSMLKEEVLERRLSSARESNEFAADGVATTEEFELLDKHEAYRIVSARTFSIAGADGQPRQVSFLMDITDQKKHEQRLAYAANHDTLTGLPNRALFNDRLDYALKVAARERESLAVFQIDLDRFKSINDRFGHAAGDEVLKTVARRLSAVLRVSDTVARLGGDEFAIILPNSDEAGALQVAGKIRAAVSPAIEVEHSTVAVGASIGIALYPEHAADGDTLMQYADSAMYVAKGTGGSAVVYSMLRQAGDLPSMAVDQREAIENGHLHLWYQPVVNCHEERTTRVQALVHWQHPVFGLLESADLIPIAEQVRTIDALTVWMLEQVLRQMGIWQKQRMSLDVSVNVSIDVLLDQHFTDLIAALLRQYEVAAGRLILEISEAAVMRNADLALLAIQRLAALGVRITLDGVGARQTSFELVSRLPISEIKIDKSIIRQLCAAYGPAMIGGILGLSKGLGLGTVAEGVEDRKVWEQLQVMGCYIMQGYYLCRPLPPEEIVAWVRAGERGLATAGR